MTRTRLFRSRSSKEKEEEQQQQHYSKHNITSSTGMRVIVPLQGMVQGRGGLFLGSVIPCALFYFFQLYLKQHRSQPNPPPLQPPPENLGGQLAEVSVSVLPRSLSRVHLSPRSLDGPAYVSGCKLVLIIGVNVLVVYSFWEFIVIKLIRQQVGEDSFDVGHKGVKPKSTTRATLGLR